MKIVPLVVGLAVLAVAPAPARAATISVAPGTGTLQAAIDAAADGDTLLLGPGTYAGAVTVDGRANLRIRGRGAAVIDASGSRTGLNIVNVNGLRVEGVTISNATYNGIYVTDSSNVTLSRCSVDNSSGAGSSSGIEVDGTQDGLTIDRCTFSLWNYGVYVNSESEDPKVTISRCRIQGATDSETITVYNRNVVITRNVIVGSSAEAPTGYGIYLSGLTASCTVSRNRVSAVGDPGITILGSSHTIDRNSIRDVGGLGIQVRGSGSTISRNSVRDSGDAAFQVVTAGHTITRNKASGTTAIDLRSDVAESENTYSKNKFRTTGFPE